MAVNINIPNSAHSSQIVTLNRQSYILEFDYNTRFDFWSLSLFLPNGNPIITGEKIVSQSEFLFISAKNVILGGYLGIKSVVPTNVTRDNFGQDKNHKLVFLSQEEVDEINAVQT